MNWIKENKITLIGVVICAAVMIYGLGCESTVSSLTSTEQVNREQLNKEYTTVVAQLTFEQNALTGRIVALPDEYEGKIAILDQKDFAKQAIFNLGITTIATGATPTPITIITLALAALGLGFGTNQTVNNRKTKKENITLTARLSAVEKTAVA